MDEVESLAKALCNEFNKLDCWDSKNDLDQGLWRDTARAALAHWNEQTSVAYFKGLNDAMLRKLKLFFHDETHFVRESAIGAELDRRAAAKPKPHESPDELLEAIREALKATPCGESLEFTTNCILTAKQRAEQWRQRAEAAEWRLAELKNILESMPAYGMTEQ